MYFNTLNDKFPYMKYWLDLDTKSYLEEAAVVAPKGTEINADDAAILLSHWDTSMFRCSIMTMHKFIGTKK